MLFNDNDVYIIYKDHVALHSHLWNNFDNFALITAFQDDAYKLG